MLGRKASEETKRKMSESRKGKIILSNLNITLEQAFMVKQKLIQGNKPADIARELNIPYKTINGIVSNDTYSSVYVDGWDDFRKNRKTYHRLTKDDHKEIYRLHTQEGMTKQELAELYQRTDKMIAKIFKKQEELNQHMTIQCQAS